MVIKHLIYIESVHLVRVGAICIFLLISSGNNFKEARIEYTNNVSAEIKTEEAISLLKTKKLYLYKDIRELDSLSYVAIYNSIDDSLIKGSLTKNQVTRVLQTIAFFESATCSKKGTMPFKSKLFVKSNNAFGIKGKGHLARTMEYYNGKRHSLVLSFKSYDSFKSNITQMLSLLNRKYALESATSENEVFYFMYRNNYFTAGTKYLNSLIYMNNKLKKIQDENSTN